MKALKSQYLGILLLTLLTGCFGSSESTTATSTSTGISYDGVTDAAALTVSNSATILGGAYQGGQTGNAVGTAASLSNDHESQSPRILILSQALSNAFRKADLTGNHNSGNAAAVNDISNQVAGSCGGQMSYTGTADDTSRQVYASFTFSNYCEEATTISGTATASGQTDTTLGFSTLSLSFTALTFSSLGDSFTANGFEIITPHTGTTNVSMNMLLRDNATQLVYQIQSYEMVIIGGTSAVDVSISGRYYDPTYGFVDISTPTFLHINNVDYWPASGSIKAVGNNSNATFTSLSNTTYQLDVDSNGDGTVDSTTTGLWTDL